MSSSLEHDEQGKVIAWCKLNKIYCLRVNSGSAYKLANGVKYRISLAPEGSPDLIISLKGRFIGVEMKKDKKTIQHWVNTIEKYKETGSIAKSNERILNQYLAGVDIENSGGVYLLTYSLNDFLELIKNNGLY